MAKKKATRKKKPVRKRARKSPPVKKHENRTPDGKWKAGKSGNPDGVWKPGQSGNPKGRPKGKLLTDILREHLFDPLTDKDGNQVELMEGVPATRADLIVRKAVERAMDGSYHHMKEILERIDGKVPSKLDAAIRSKDGLANLLQAAKDDALPTDEDENKW